MLAQSRILTGTLSLRRSVAAPSAGHVTNFTVTLRPNQGVCTVSSAVCSIAGRTDSLSQFAEPFDALPGAYTVEVKPSGAIARRRTNVVVPSTGDLTLAFSQFDEGDVDGSGGVTVTDLNVVKSRFATTCASGAALNVCPDLNRDGRVTLLDFSLLSRSYGRVGPIDEP